MNQRAPQFKSTFVSNSVSIFIQPMLPHSVIFVNMKALRLSSRIIGIGSKQCTRNMLKCNIKFHLESIRALRHYMHMVEKRGREVVSVLAPNEVDGQHECEY